MIDLIFDALRLTAIGLGVMVIDRAGHRALCEWRAWRHQGEAPYHLEPLPDVITTTGAIFIGLVPIFAFTLPLAGNHIGWLELKGPYKPTSMIAVALLCLVLPMVAARFSDPEGRARFGFTERQFTAVWCLAWAMFSFATIATLYLAKGLV